MPKGVGYPMGSSKMASPKGAKKKGTKRGKGGSKGMCADNCAG